MNSSLEQLAHILQNSHFAAGYFDALLKSLIVLALAGGICALARRASAATRHLIWLLAVASLPCLSLLTLLPSVWEKPVWTVSTGLAIDNQFSLALNFSPLANVEAAAPQTPEAAADMNVTSGGSRKLATHFNMNWMVFGFAVWGAGVALVLTTLAIGQFRLHRFARQAHRLPNAGWTMELEDACESLRLRRRVILMQSADNIMPLTWGWWRPVVLLAAGADNWPMERRRIVLLHELAHVKRWDCLTQFVGQVVCAFYWFNPLVWLAARQMGVERERACDDWVLNSGCKASDYAGHLVEIAETFRRVPQMAVVAMARPSGLAQRVEAILDGRRNRNRVARFAMVLLMAAFLGLGWLIGSQAAETLAPAWALKNSAVGEQLKRFVEEKQAQEASLLKADEEEFNQMKSSGVDVKLELRLPDCQPFFDAASKGDWLTTSNLGAQLEAGAFGKTTSTNGFPHGMWLNPVKETFGAVEAFANGNGKYSEMFGWEVIQSLPPGSIYFGGTDPGRFIVTAMQKSHVQGMPFFTLTQNALADGTYLHYLRSIYEGEIYIPTGDDSQKCFEDYITAAQVRLKENKLEPGEDIKVTPGRVQASGVTAVMEINALLVKIIFDKNPGREVFLEESYPLEWMYPHLEPHGLIFKINRQPLAELSGAMVQEDRAYWQKLVPGMIGDWLKDDTSVQETVQFAEKVFVRHDLHGFTGDPDFVQNDYSSRMFSKLRNSQAGLYAWRAGRATIPEEKERLTRAADFAFRQALALCPDHPELIERYAAFLKTHQRESDAQIVQNLTSHLKSAAAKTTAKPVFQLRLVQDHPSADTEAMAYESQNISTNSSRIAEWLNVEKTVLLDQGAIRSAVVAKNPLGLAVIDVSFTDSGGKQFAEITRQHIGQKLAIIMDGKLLTAPVIQSEISGGKCQINGSFSEAEAEDLTAKINRAIAK